MVFTLSKEVVKKILDEKVDYNDLPRNGDNEMAKGVHFEDQAIANSALQKNYVPKCSVLEDICKKEKCRLYAKRSGRIKGGWICREYKVDFPDAPFDSRCHVALVGMADVNIIDSIKNLQELEKKGGKYVCLKCYGIYANKPTQIYEDGHGGRDIEMCKCGCDLFVNINSFIINMKK